MAAAQSTGSAISLTPIVRQQVFVPIQGTSPLIVHRFDEKARRQMLDDQVKNRTKPKRDPQDPDAEYERSRYRLEDGRDGFPAVAFKAALVHAARLYEGVTMVALKSAIFIGGIGRDMLLPIDGEPRMREDVARVGMGTPNLRYRAEYWPWRVVLPVTFVPSVVDQGSVLALVSAAGIGGVGEWRPSAPKSATGSYGQFDVIDGEVTFA